MKSFYRIILFIFLIIITPIHSNSAEKVEYLKTDWSFKGLFGKFDRSSLQRGYQVYTEVCSSCHSMKYLSYRNLAEKGGPEFSLEQAKAIAASFEVKDGPNADGEMFTRPGRLSDKFGRIKFVTAGSLSFENNPHIKYSRNITITQKSGRFLSNEQELVRSASSHHFIP